MTELAVCPICKGSGKKRRLKKKYVGATIGGVGDWCFDFYPCNGCDGKGWVKL